MSSAAMDVAAVFAIRWSALPPREREAFYNDVRLFMRFYTETTTDYRNLLHSELSERDRSEVRCRASLSPQAEQPETSSEGAACVDRAHD